MVLPKNKGFNRARLCLPRRGILWLAVSPDALTIVTSLQDFDSHVTHDAGSHWSELASHNFALYEDGFNALHPGNPSVCYAFDEASGLLVSNDGCRTYGSPSHAAKQLLSNRLMTTPLAFDPKNPHKLYVVSGDIVGAGFAKAPRAVFTTDDGGATFQRKHWPLGEPGAIVVDPHNGSHIVVGDLANQKRSSIRVTFDGGKTWATSRGVPVTAFWYAFTISPADGNVVIASSVDAKNDVFVLRSTDGARTFKRVANVTNRPLIRGPVDRDLAARYAQPPPAFVYSPVRQIVFDPSTSARRPFVALTTLRGAFLSRTGGTNWQRLDRDLIAHSFWGIAWRNGYLYLGSDGQGILIHQTRALNDVEAGHRNRAVPWLPPGARMPLSVAVPAYTVSLRAYWHAAHTQNYRELRFYGAGTTSGMNPSQHLVCACGNPTEMMCFFSQSDAHGVCQKCGIVRLIELESGRIVSRWVCNDCWKNRRSTNATIP